MHSRDAVFVVAMGHRSLLFRVSDHDLTPNLGLERAAESFHSACSKLTQWVKWVLNWERALRSIVNIIAYICALLNFSP